MRINPASLSRAAAVPALVVVLMLAATHAARAQACVCDHITVRVDPSVACTIELHLSAPLCRFAPVFATPGVPVEIACCDDMDVTIVGCNGNDVTFQQGGPLCFTGVAIAPGCCIDACLGLDIDGCPVIRIRPAGGICVC